MPLPQSFLDTPDSVVNEPEAAPETVPRFSASFTNSLDAEVGTPISEPGTTDAKMAVSTALATNADQYARAAQLAKQYGTSTDFAERNLDWLEEQAKLQTIEALPPATKAALGDPHIAKLSHDDMQHIAELETRLGGFDSAEPIQPPKATVGSVIAGLAQNVESGAEITRQSLRMQFGDLFGFNTVTEDAARKDALARTDLAIANPQFESDLAAGAYSGISSLLQQAPAMAAGVLTGGAGIPLAAAGITTQAEAYTRYRDREASPLTAFGGGIAEGAIEVATESISMGYFVSKFGKKGFAEFMANFLIREQIGEQFATHLQDAVDTAVQNPDKTWGEYWKERPSAAVQTFAAVMAMGGAVAPLQFAAHRHEKKVQAAQVAIQHAKALDQIRAIAANSVLRERSPEDFAKVLDQMVGSERDFYVDGNVLLQAIESGGEQAAGVIAQAPTVAEQLDEGLPTNGLIRIPAKEFLTAFSGSGLDEALVPHLRVTEDAPSAAESEEFLQQAEEIQKQAVEAAKVKMASDQAFIDSAHAVEAKILADLTTANRWTDDVNKTYAQLARDFVVTQAAREGITPEDFFARYSLRTVATPVEGFDQGNDNGLRRDGRPQHPNHGRTLSGGTPDAGWEASSGLQSRDGTPVFFRASRAGTTAGSFERLGANTTHPSSGLGLWFSNSEADASSYGPKVEAFKLNLKRPKIYAGGDLPAFETLEDAKAFTKELQAQGYDGVVHDMRDVGGKVHAVAFSPDQVVFEQNDSKVEAFGSFNPKTLTISLLQNADLSTWLHELGHFQLAVLADMAARPNAPPGAVEDMNTLLDWFKVKDLATWNEMSLEEQRASHEKFARSFEAYLFEGKAPTLDLEPVFARIKTFMMRVYKSVKDILSRAGASPTPEVRAVFDRLLAAEADIKAAEEARSMLPLFKTREEFPGTDEGWQAYQNDIFDAHEAGAAQLQARSLRDMQWMANLRVRMLKAKQKEAAAIRKGVLEEVVNELSATPVYAVQDFLRGKERAPLSMDWLTTDQRTALMEIEASNTKLDLDMLKAMYGEAPDAPWRELPTGKNGLAGLEGLDPEVVAKLFNFQSADEMIKAILAAPPRETAAEGEVDRRMLMEHGDLNDARAIEEAVNDAIHNKVRTRVIATTLGALDKAVKNTRDMTKALRGMVKESLAGRRVGDIKPGRHVAAESRAAKEAEAALKKGDNKGAANAVRQQLWHNLSATEARNVEKEIERELKYLRRFRKAVDSIAQDYQDQIHVMLANFDLVERSETQMKRAEDFGTWLEAKEKELGFTPVVDTKLMSLANQKNYKRMTLEEFRGLVTSVKSMAHVGRTKQDLLASRAKRELNETAAKLKAYAEEHAPRVVGERFNKFIPLDAVTTSMDSMIASHQKVSEMMMGGMDGNAFKPGLWHEVFIEPLNAAGADEALRNADTNGTLIKIFKPVIAAANWRQRIVRQVVPGAVDKNGKPLSLSYEERLVVALNSGNEDNMQRLRDGRRWTDGTVQAIHTSLTESDWKYVQSVWDHLDTYKKPVFDLEKELFGVEPKSVDPKPFSVTTSDGKTLQMKGGYYPIGYDEKLNLVAAVQESIAETRQQVLGAFGKATTRSSHVKERAKEVKDRPLKLQFTVLYKHINDVNHRLAWEKTLADMRRLLAHPEVKESLSTHLGPQAVQAIHTMMTDIAASDMASRKWFDGLCEKLAGNASLSMMGFNIKTALTQTTGLTQTAVVIGYKATWDGMQTFYKGPKEIAEIAKSKSKVMRTRALTWNQNVRYLRAKLSATRSVIDNAAFVPMTFMQGAVDTITWAGAYRKGLNEHMEEADAIAYADQAVLTSQGGGQTKDLASAQRGKGVMRAFTAFYNYGNTTLGLAHSVAVREKTTKADYARALNDYMLLTIIPTILLVELTTVINLAVGGDDDDDKRFIEKMGREGLASMLGWFVGLREFASVAMGFDYQGPAGLRVIPALNKAAKQVAQGENDTALWRALNQFGGLAFGYSATQYQRTAEGAAAIAEGETINPLVLLFGPPKE